jgi:uncharacterized membrane protein
MQGIYIAKIVTIALFALASVFDIFCYYKKKKFWKVPAVGIVGMGSIAAMSVPIIAIIINAIFMFLWLGILFFSNLKLKKKKYTGPPVEKIGLFKYYGLPIIFTILSYTGTFYVVYSSIINNVTYQNYATGLIVTVFMYMSIAFVFAFLLYSSTYYKFIHFAFVNWYKDGCKISLKNMKKNLDKSFVEHEPNKIMPFLLIPYLALIII